MPCRTGTFAYQHPDTHAFREKSRLVHQDNQRYRMTFGSADDDEHLRIRLSESVAEIVRRQHTTLSQRDAHQLPGEPLQIFIDREEF